MAGHVSKSASLTITLSIDDWYDLLEVLARFISTHQRDLQGELKVIADMEKTGTTSAQWVAKQSRANIEGKQEDIALLNRLYEGMKAAIIQDEDRRAEEYKKAKGL